MRPHLFAAIVVCVASLVAQRTACASTITGTYSVTGSDFISLGTPPYSSITESFTITFDNTVLVTRQTAGITLNASTITPASTLAFTYIPLTDTLIVGGIAATVAIPDPTSFDFAILIGNASSLSNFNPLTLSYSVGRNNVYAATTVKRTAQAAAVTPEPSSLALLGTGIFGMVAAVRKRSI